MSRLKAKPIKRGPGRPKGSKNKPKTPNKEATVVAEVKPLILKPIVSNQYNGYTRSVTFKVDGGYSTTLIVHNNPTNNCQLFCIQGFNALRQWKDTVQFMPKYKGKKFKIDYLPILKMIKATGGKRIMFIDVKRMECTFVEKLFPKECIIARTDYQSTNNSAMTTYLINMSRYV